MSKKFFSLLIVILACLAVATYLFASRTPQSGVPALPPPAPSSTAQILIPVDLFAGERISGHSDLINSSTGTEITFRELTDELHRGRSPSYEVSENQNRIGEANGYLMMPIFSTDGRFLAFRSMWVTGCAGTCFDSSIYVVNLIDRAMIQIVPPREQTAYTGSVRIPEGEVNNAIIEPYGWDTDSLKVLFYYSGFSMQDNKDYRVGPKELWRYDLTTKQYTLLETLPESSTSSTP